MRIAFIYPKGASCGVSQKQRLLRLQLYLYYNSDFHLYKRMGWEEWAGEGRSGDRKINWGTSYKALQEHI